MVAHLVRLKLTLLRNGLRRSVWQTLATALAWVWGLGTGVLVVAGVVALRAAPVEAAGPVVTLGGSLLLLGWAVVPVVAFGVDETLDPARFATLPVPRRSLLPGLAVAGLIGVPGVVTALVSLATVVTWTRTVAAVLVAAVCAVLAVATCVVASRASTTLAARVLASRRVRELGAGLAVVALIGVGLAPNLLSGGEVSLRLADLDGPARVLGWTPLGWVWSAPWDVAAGSAGTGVLKVLLAAGLLAGLVAAWSWALERQLVRPPVSGAVTVRGRSALDRLPGPTGAVTARCLRYWRRDSRYLTSVLTMLALPAVLGVLAVTGAVEAGTAALFVGPAIAGLVGWGLHNDVAYDGSAVWMHVAAGLPGRADRWGRVAAVMVWAVPLVLVVTTAGAGLAGRWELLPATLGLSVALLGAGAGISSVASAVAPYPVPEAGRNPFATPPGHAVQTLLAQAGSSLATVVPALPAAVPLVLAWRTGSALATWLALVLGLATGVTCLVAGVRVGGMLFERRGPELLAALTR